MKFKRFLPVCAAAIFVLSPMVSAERVHETVKFKLERAGRSEMIARNLQDLEFQVGDSIALVTRQGVQLLFNVKFTRQTEAGNTVISGISEKNGSLFLVANSSGEVEGSIRGTLQRYRIFSENNQIALIKFDESVKPRPADTGSRLIPRPRRRMNAHVQVSKEYEASKNPEIATELTEVSAIFPEFQLGTAVIDVLIYYAEEMMGDVSLIADLMVEITNEAMRDSDIKIQLNLVGLEGLPISGQESQEEILEKMFSASDPFVAIEADRSDYQADLVIAIREQIPPEDDSCGIAYIGVQQGFPWRRIYMSSVQWQPYEASEPGSYCENTTFAHEIGHLLGSMHERRLYEEGDLGAFDYSFGHYREGVFKTIMSYGREEEVAVFSNPELPECAILYGLPIPCGFPAGHSSSADNASGFTNVRHMIGGYQSSSLIHELVIHHRHVRNCETPEGVPGVFRGHSMMNETQYDLEARRFSLLTKTGEVVSEEYAPGKILIRSGEERELGLSQCAGGDSLHPLGNDYVESWVTYFDPISKSLVESIHLPWEEGYEGGYAKVRVATSEGGSIAEHSAFYVKKNHTLQLRFLTDPGFQLASFLGSCDGSLEGSDYILRAIKDDCTVEAYFEAINDSGGNPEAYDVNSETMFSQLLQAIVSLVSISSGSDIGESVSEVSVSPETKTFQGDDQNRKSDPVEAIPVFSLTWLGSLIFFISIMGAAYQRYRVGSWFISCSNDK